ncbi:MAG: repeat-containing protein [Acidobacteria bacterium]|nr:repeat-containing protein [Acidobacteriota bacterium]
MLMIGSKKQSGMKLFAAIVILVSPAFVHAASVGSENKKGNQLFAEGKYEEAEKAYLNAEVKSPGRPEILYNLGNTLVKQQKYDQAIQSLRKSTEKGDKGLQEYGWYNSGNAYFESGQYEDAVKAYTKALRINPADTDAKHNLELALKKMEEQKQASSSGNQQNDQQQDEAQQNQQKRSQEQAADQQEQPNKPEDQNRAASPQATSAEQKEGLLSKERALQILDALQSQELAEQQKLLERRARQKTNQRDW